VEKRKPVLLLLFSGREGVRAEWSFSLGNGGRRKRRPPASVIASEWGERRGKRGISIHSFVHRETAEKIVPGWGSGGKGKGFFMRLSYLIRGKIGKKREGGKRQYNLFTFGRKDGGGWKSYHC